MFFYECNIVNVNAVKCKQDVEKDRTQKKDKKKITVTAVQSGLKQTDSRRFSHQTHLPPLNFFIEAVFFYFQSAFGCLQEGVSWV